MNAVLDRLASPLDVDTILSTFNPLWGSKLRGVIESVEPLTSDSAKIRIRPGRSWRGSIPGQFVTIGVDVDGVRHHRCFSLTSPPESAGGLIEIAVHCGGSGFVSRHLVHSARPGEIVQLTQAEGDFVLPVPSASTTGRYLFVTGGSGITPVMAILRSLDAPSSDGGGLPRTTADVVLLHHSRTADRMMFRSELLQMAASSEWLKFIPTFTRGGGRHLDLARLESECPDWESRHVYVCGPAALIEFVHNTWESIGRSSQVHSERFSFAGHQAACAANDGEMPTGSLGASDGSTHFVRAQRTIPTQPDRPLLEVAEEAGLNPAYGCRMGICHTCSTRLVEGSAVDLLDGRISGPGGHVRICVSSAIDDVSLDL